MRQKALLFLIVATLVVLTCSACQSQETLVICGNCAAKVPESSQYCSSCGAQMLANEGSTPPTDSNQGSAENTGTSATVGDPTTETNSPATDPPATEAPHTHNYTPRITTDATCTTDGIMTYTCKHCSDEYTETIPKYGHDYIIPGTSKSPTCTMDGENTYLCYRCDDCITEVVAKYGHSYITYTSKNPTCTENGETTTYCYRCDDAFTEPIPSTGHSWVEASCAEAKYCTECGESEGAALGHTTRDGICSRCSQEISLEDIYSIGVPMWPKHLHYSQTKYISGEKVYLDHDIVIYEVTYGLTDNGDGTANLKLTITVLGTQCSDERLRYARFETWLLGEGDVDDVEFKQTPSVTLTSYANTRTVTVTFVNLLPGHYEVTFLSVDDS